MNPKIKVKWLAALRSGKYKQGRNALRPTDDRFCCLGVLCDVVAPKKWDKRALDESLTSHDGQNELPTHAVRERAGIPFEALYDLATKNDSERCKFTIIANWIEKNL